MLRVFPFLSLPVLAYFILVATDEASLTTPIASFTLVSGASFTLAANEALILFALGVLFFEIIKASFSSHGSVWDHALSLVLFAGCLIAFLSLPLAATSTFLFLTAISFIDVVAGYSIAIRVARRDISVM